MYRGGLLALKREYEALDGLFLLHQEALRAGQFTDALTCLNAFEDRLRVHIRTEEDGLLPGFEAHYPNPAPTNGASTDVYRVEHRKLLKLLAAIRHALGQLASTQNGRPRNIIRLLDSECRFKHLIERHNARELLAVSQSGTNHVLEIQDSPDKGG